MHHYLYKITDTDNEMCYIGSRSSKVIPSEDLGITYFSSSNDKYFMSKQKNNPELFTYQILEEYNSKKEALAAEMLILKVTNARSDNSYYNGICTKELRSYPITRAKHFISYLGSMIKLTRKEHGMSESELAERSGLSRATLRRIESGQENSLIIHYMNCCCILGIDLLRPKIDNSENISNLMNKIVEILPLKSNSNIELFDDF